MTRITPFSSVILLTVLAASACSPVASNRISTSTSDANASTYQTLSSTATATSELGGVALQFRENPDTTTLSSSSGALNHGTGATRINDGKYDLVDPDGIAAGGLLSDGISALISTPAQGFTNNYDYARVYNQGYISQGVPYSVTGIYGIVTRTGDMPSSGSATYRGEADGSYTDGTTTYDLDGGTSSVTANFSSRAVTVRMEGFNAVNRSSGAAANVGFDAVQISNMTISGNSYTGGTINTQSGSSNVSVVGTRLQQNATGRFFGLTSSATPDETGGIGFLRGTNGAVTAVFLAD